MMQRFVYKLVVRLFQGAPLLYRGNTLFRKCFWHISARTIDDTWGKGTSDFECLAAVITLVSASCILDIGCGSGRLFPLYHSLHVREVVAQDISVNALHIAESRHHYNNVTLTSTPINRLSYFPQYFDLAVSNRVLQHIPPNEIDKLIHNACKLERYVYINEASESDRPAADVAYMFEHDYQRLFHKCGYALVKEGRIGKQAWFLFSGAVS